MKFLLGDCSNSAIACEYSHRKEDAPLCRIWQKGLCIGAVGNACKFRHFYSENDENSLQGRQLVGGAWREADGQLQQSL